jgi:hypothetical protein
VRIPESGHKIREWISFCNNGRRNKTRGVVKTESDETRKPGTVQRCIIHTVAMASWTLLQSNPDMLLTITNRALAGLRRHHDFPERLIIFCRCNLPIDP